MTERIEIRNITALIHIEDGESFSGRYVDLRIPEDCTVEQAIAALAAFQLRHSDGAQTTKPVSEVGPRVELPAGLCGALNRNTEACVFTPHEEGTKHSWE